MFARRNIILLSLLFVCSVHAQQPGLQTRQPNSRLATPRQTVVNFINWQQPAHYKPEIAAEGFAIDAEITLEKRIELARQLKRVLDARGLFVKFETIPDDPAYQDSLTGRHEYVLFAQLPEVYLQKVDDRWLFSRKTIVAIPRLYRETFSEWVEYVVDRLPGFFTKSNFGIALWQLAGVFLIILLAQVVRKAAEFFLERFAKKLVMRTRLIYDEKLIDVSRRPVGLLLMSLIFMLAYPNLQFGVTLNMVLRVALLVMFYISIIWLFYRLVDVLELFLREKTAKTRSKLDDQLVPLVRKTLKIFIVVMGSIFVLQNLEVDVTSLLTGLGLGGLAFALAARDTLANFFGSVTIFVDKPFQVGDWIISGGIEGTVEEVGFRSTRIRTFYNSLVSVPNAKLADSAIDNMGLRVYRRVKTYIGLTYSTTADQMQAFVEGVQAIIRANPHTRKDYYEIHFNQFGNFSLNVLVYFFLKVENWSQELRERHNIFLEILRLAEQIGVEFAFPTQTVHVDSFYQDLPRPVGKKLPKEQLSEVVRSFGPGGELARPEGPQLTYNGRKLDFRPGRTVDEEAKAGMKE